MLLLTNDRELMGSYTNSAHLQCHRLDDGRRHGVLCPRIADAASPPVTV